MALGMGDVAAENIALTAPAERRAGSTALKATVDRYRRRVRVVGRRDQDGRSTDAEGLDQGGRGARSTFSFVNPVVAGVAVLAAGIGFLTYEMLQSRQASQKFAAPVNQALTQSSATQFLSQVPQFFRQQDRRD